MFISLNNYFYNNNYTYCEAYFIEIINIFIRDPLFFNYILYELELLLYFT